MSNNKTSSSSISLNIIPQLQDNSSNWFNFEQRVEECFIIAGLVIIIQQAKEPVCLAPVSDLLGQPALLATACTKYNIKIADYKMVKKVYNKVIPGWEEKQGRAYMVIRFKYRYNNY
jgi:hypothetical protein